MFVAAHGRRKFRLIEFRTPVNVADVLPDDVM